MASNLVTCCWNDLTSLHAWQVIRPAKLWCDVESAEEAKHLSKQWSYHLKPKLITQYSDVWTNAAAVISQQRMHGR